MSSDPAPSSSQPIAITPQIRHDFYQTDEKVVVTVMIKNATNCTVQIQPQHVHMSATDYTLDLDLAHPIDVERSNYRVGTVKVEITLAKLVGERWAGLTRPASEAAAAAVPDKVANIYKQDWDSLEKQIENNEEEYKEVSALCAGKRACSPYIWHRA